ncbi:acyl-CoA thioesterase [Litoribrevibacter euphylliae]|uniref:Acyl-CoA thioesterase n=1 Tax=Litoribrevibacter euphylliae TaxID=1834034 RepID=A0ABV7HI10_9GAMM
MSLFQMQFQPRWSDLDPNQHVRHSAYNDFATQVRFTFLQEHGFSQGRFMELGIGAVLFREETTFRKEIGMSDSFTVDFEVVELSKTGKRWKFAHNFWLPKESGKDIKAATVSVEGSWINLSTRKFASPPTELLNLFQNLTQ